jgi:hypothetical protein
MAAAFSDLGIAWILGIKVGMPVGKEIVEVTGYRSGILDQCNFGVGGEDRKGSRGSSELHWLVELLR